MFYLSYREYGLSKMVSSHLFYRVRWIIPERLGKLRVQKGEPCMKLDKQTYQQLLERKSPNSPLWRDCLLAFLIGGAICTVGEGVRQLWLSRGLDTEDTAAATAITMVFLGALLTCLHLYEKLAKYAGAGTIVPITGFANAIVSPAMEFKSEGLILGLGAKLFVSSAVPEGTIIGLDRRYALEMVQAGGINVEYDKLIDCQMERAAVTSIAGFSKIFPDAVKVLA